LDRLLRDQPQQHGAQQQMRAVLRLQLTHEAEHRLVASCFAYTGHAN